MVKKELKNIEASIFEEIHKAKSILLICHPSPDPDSVGSNLAFKFFLESIGKEATLISGDSKITDSFRHFIGADKIIEKNFFEIKHSDFDLFIILDIASPNQISKLRAIESPLPIRSIIIDHHLSNKGFADINLIDSDKSSTAELVYEILEDWKINMNRETASNLFLGIYTDTVGLKIETTTPRTYEIMTKLTQIVPDFSDFISKMENSESPENIKLYGYALSSVKEFAGGELAISFIGQDTLNELGVKNTKLAGSMVTNILKTVPKWKVVISMIETEPNRIKCSLRASSPNKYDVSKLSMMLGGGGHKAASGAYLIMSYEQAEKLVVDSYLSLFSNN
jgi:phosphoesterase RecJ-like protein